MKLTAFKFTLPKEQIALYPSKDRDGSRLMVLDRKTGKIEHKKFKNIIDYFDDGDVFVRNDTKVFPARMWGNKEKTGAKIEVFLLRELNRDSLLWDVIVDPARKIRIGNKLYGAAPCASCSTAPMTSSSAPSPRWARRRCRTTSSAIWNPAMPSATRPSTPGTRAPWRPPPPVCTSAAS
jgi:hypothetical protein